MKNDEIDIILVEDNPEDAELTTRALKKNNISSKLLHLKDGAEALDYFFCTGKYADRNPEMKPKIVLLDLKMPKVSGMQVLEKLKSDDFLKTIPVVVLTSSKEDPDVEKCYKLGANSYIVKPVGFDNFIKAVAELGLYWLVTNHSKG